MKITKNYRSESRDLKNRSFRQLQWKEEGDVENDTIKRYIARLKLK